MYRYCCTPTDTGRSGIVVDIGFVFLTALSSIDFQRPVTTNTHHVMQPQARSEAAVSRHRVAAAEESAAARRRRAKDARARLSKFHARAAAAEAAEQMAWRQLTADRCVVRHQFKVLCMEALVCVSAVYHH